MSQETPSSEFEKFVAKEATHEKIALPELERLPQELQEAMREIPKISGTWNPVEIYTADPESIKVEKPKVIEAFRKGEEYNPKFTYSRAMELDPEQGRAQLLELQKKVRSTKAESRVDRLARVAIDRKIKDDLATTYIIEGIKGQDDTIVSKGFKLKYEGMDAATYKVVQEVYREFCDPNKKDEPLPEALLNKEEMQWLESTEFTDSEFADACREILEQYHILRPDEGGEGFEVALDARATAIDVRDKSTKGHPTVFIPEGRKLKGSALLTLLDHEIGGHARQSMNGERLFGVGGGSLKFDEEVMYEGLGFGYEARTMRELFGKKDVPANPFFGLAIKSAQEGKSFAQIFSEQVDYRMHALEKTPPNEKLKKSFAELTEEEQNKVLNLAWPITYRVMRGHVNMENKEAYAMEKDIAYLKGTFQQRELDKAGLGHKNESAIAAKGGLLMLAEFELKPENLPIKYEVVGPDGNYMTPGRYYWETKLKPRMRAEQAQKAQPA